MESLKDITLTHEEYVKQVAAVPLERYRAKTLIQHECQFKHIILATPESMLEGRTCAHCNGHDALNAVETIKKYGFTVKPGTSMYSSGGQKMLVLIDGLGRGRPFSVNDLSNGLYPGLELPKPTGMYLYYMKIKEFWKIGVSHNPWRRLSMLEPEILWTRFYDHEQSARREEAMIKEKYKEFRNKNRHALGPHNDGWTELFTKDIFNV